MARSPRIVGFAEHITSDIGSLGDFAAGAETAFGTVLQRCYAFLGGRMHYGHPDMMNKARCSSMSISFSHFRTCFGWFLNILMHLSVSVHPFFTFF